MEDLTSHWRGYKLYQKERFTCNGGKEVIRQPSKRSGRQTVPWTEDIPIEDIVLHFFGNRGQTATTTCIRELKLAYILAMIYS